MAPKQIRQRTNGGLFERFVVIGGTFLLGVIGFIAFITTRMHEVAQHEASQSASSGAPVLVSPSALRQSTELNEAADNHVVITRKATEERWLGLNLDANRVAGPFPNLPGNVGTISFTYADVVAEFDSSNYPPFEPLLDIIKRWNPDNTDNIPNPFHETLQVFNFSDPTQRNMAKAYRNAEVPFKVFGISEIDNVAELWTDSYLTKNIERNSQTAYKVERSVDNHFMYWVAKQRYKGPIGEFKPPTTHVKMGFAEWLKKARAADATGIDPSEEHFYLTTGVEPGRVVARDRSLQQFISKDLSIFSTTKDNFFVTDVKQNKGIQCRFGMKFACTKGVIAEAHYDSGRNMVAMLKGAKRYILAPPTECKYLSILKEVRHPSYRHSTADWSDPSEALEDHFDLAKGIDTIVHEGEVLYIPSFWFHYIIALDYSVQCNTRSGFPPAMNGKVHISECMDGDMDDGEIKAQKKKNVRIRKSHHSVPLELGSLEVA